MHLIHLPDVDSTQIYAKLWLDEHPNASWSAVLADNQTHGIGQWGRAWESIPGNLHVTYIAPLPANPMMGLRMVEILHCVLIEYALQVKWPNDIFLHGKKCGGVLCEAYSTMSSSRGSQTRGELLQPGDCRASNDARNDRKYTLIGLGLNIAHAPEGRSCLNLSMPPIDLCQTIGQHLMNWDMTCKRPWNLPPLLYQNTWIDYTSPQGEVSNIYVEGLSDDGALMARGENGGAVILHSGRLGLAGVRT